MCSRAERRGNRIRIVTGAPTRDLQLHVILYVMKLAAIAHLDHKAIQEVGEAANTQWDENFDEYDGPTSVSARREKAPMGEDA